MTPEGYAADLAGALTELRAYANARQESRVTVRRKTGRKVQDESNGYKVPEWAVIYTDLPFRSDSGGSSDGGSRKVTISGVTYEQATGVGHFPASTIDLADSDYVEVTVGEWAGDVFRIVAAIRYDQKTARRLPIVEESRPEEWL